jgi:ribosomal protein S12 methylthiotransferase accessory factor
MTTGLALPTAAIPHLLRTETARIGNLPADRIVAETDALVRGILARGGAFGITRVGSITRLDRIGLPIVQVVRPLALSNAVTQGKGIDELQAVASALMECLERWAGQNVPEARVTVSSARALGDDTRGLYTSYVADGPDDWDRRPLPWIDGWDLLTGRSRPVPLALVDTVYTLPSPHQTIFPRTTTGLAGGASLFDAILHAGFEILEKDAVAGAYRRPFFFERWQVDPNSVSGPRSGLILRRIRAAGLMTGIWRVPSDHGLPVYWCHVMEDADSEELAPLPAEGFGCDLTHDSALAKALLEACQARGGAIAGAREDITRRHYPSAYDRSQLSEWRQGLSVAAPIEFPREPQSPPARVAALESILGALQSAGARAVLVVPLFNHQDPPIHIIRMIAPPLRHGLRTID